MTAAGSARPFRGPLRMWRGYTDRLESRPLAWLLAPLQFGLRLVPFFVLPFVSSGLTKWQVFPFLKPETFAWNGLPEVASGAAYQFANRCDFCFNIRIWGSEADPLVQWVLPFPTVMAGLAGVMEIVLPALILVGLLTRLSALGLLGMTTVIQLVIPTGLPVHAMWVAVLVPIVVLGPGILSLDHLVMRRLGRA